MSNDYILSRFALSVDPDGIFPLTIPAGSSSSPSIDTTTGLNLIGYGTVNYGKQLNENFLYLLEHMAGPSQPATSITGMLWYDTTANAMKVYNGSSYSAIGGTYTLPIADSSTLGGVKIGYGVYQDVTGAISAIPTAQTTFHITDATTHQIHLYYSIQNIILGHNANIAVDFPAEEGQAVTLVFQQDATGGRTVTFDSSVETTTYTPTTAPNAVDYVTLTWNTALYKWVVTSSSSAATPTITAVTPGSYTNTNLTVDAHGRITAASNGSAGASALTTLTDVTISSPTNGQVLHYNTSSSKWVNVTPSTFAYTAPVQVQSTYASNKTGSINLTFGSSPTTNNILVFWAMGSPSAHISPPAGLSQIFYSNPTSGQSAYVWVRTVVGGDSSSWTFSAPDDNICVFGMELQNVSDLQISAGGAFTATNQAYYYAFQNAESRFTSYVAFECDNSNTLSSITGAGSVLHPINNFGASGNHPAAFASITGTGAIQLNGSANFNNAMVCLIKVYGLLS